MDITYMLKLFLHDNVKYLWTMNILMKLVGRVRKYLNYKVRKTYNA